MDVLALILAALAVANGFTSTRQYRIQVSKRMLKSTALNVEPLLVVEELLSYARKVGPIGSLATEEEREKVKQLTHNLTNRKGIRSPARTRLRGTHDLVYSAAPGGSSGRLFGPVYGKVTQEFLEDDKTFINAVKIGPLEISLQAEKFVKDDKTNIVKFRKSIVKVLGKTVVEKEITGGGVWKYLFMGEVRDEKGRKTLLRVMETPSLFIIEQPLANP
jgi:PAP_fibrillin